MTNSAVPPVMASIIDEGSGTAVSVTSPSV